MALDQPRYLDRRAGRSYTEEPMFKMRGEAEPVDEATQQRYSDEARRRFADSRADELFLRDARSRSVRLRNVQNEVRRLGVDARRELGVIDAPPARRRTRRVVQMRVLDVHRGARAPRRVHGPSGRPRRPSEVA